MPGIFSTRVNTIGRGLEYFLHELTPLAMAWNIPFGEHGGGELISSWQNIFGVGARAPIGGIYEYIQYSMRKSAVPVYERVNACALFLTTIVPDASDWSVVRIYLRFLHLIGPSSRMHRVVRVTVGATS